MRHDAAQCGRADLSRGPGQDLVDRVIAQGLGNLGRQATDQIRPDTLNDLTRFQIAAGKVGLQAQQRQER